MPVVAPLSELITVPSVAVASPGLVNVALAVGTVVGSFVVVTVKL